jgi:multidrug efflux system membrane fusion protein
MRAIAERLEAVVRTDEDAMAISSAQGLVSDAEAGVDSAKSPSPYHSIRSPIDGLAKNLSVNPGETVSARDATTLVTIEQVNPIYVSFGVPAAQLSDLKRCVGRGELRVAATISDDTSNAEQGSIGFIDDTASGGTGTALLKATFDNKDRQLLPGQLVNVVLTLKLLPDSVVIPSSAIKIEGQGRFVFVVQSDQTVESRPVVVAETVGDKSVITSGLTPGKIVVTDSQVPLQPGSKVNTTGK